MKVLLLNAGHNDLGLIRGLKKLGAQIVVTGKTPGLIGAKYCDKYIQADYSDMEKILEIAKEEHADRICPCCNDYGVYTAAYVAEKLGLPGHDSYETVCRLNHKDKFKKLARELDLITPWSEAFTDTAQAERFLKTVKYPVMVKPSDASAGNGAAKAENLEEACHAVSQAFGFSRKHAIVIEQYVSGSQHGFSTFLVREKVMAYCSNNEYSFVNPYRVEIDTFPADGYEKAAEVLIPEIEKIAQTLHLKDGIFHLQYMLSDEKPQILEVMRRAVGNMYSVPADQLTGISWDYWEARARCGMDCSDFPVPVRQQGYFAYKAVLGSRDGVIKRIEIPQDYDKYLFSQCMIKKPGDVIRDYKSDPAGFLFFMFQSAEEMQRVLIEEYRCDLIQME